MSIFEIASDNFVVNFCTLNRENVSKFKYSFFAPKNIIFTVQNLAILNFRAKNGQKSNNWFLAWKLKYWTFLQKWKLYLVHM